MGSELRKEKREGNTIFVPKPTSTCRQLLVAAVHLIEDITCSGGFVCSECAISSKEVLFFLCNEACDEAFVIPRH